MDELAELFRIGKTVVYRNCRSGLWPHTKVARQLRFTEQHIAAIVALGEPENASGGVPAIPLTAPQGRRRSAAAPVVELDPYLEARRKIA